MAAAITPPSGTPTGTSIRTSRGFIRSAPESAHSPRSRVILLV